MPTENRITLETGVTLPYAVQGDPDGTPVLLLHGFAATWRAFESLLPHLPDHLRVCAPTLRYFPGATVPQEPFHIRHLSDDLPALMAELDLQKAVVVGHSMGSAVAQRFAIDHPQITRGLVLVGGRPESPGDPGVHELWETTISHLQDPIDPEFIRAFIDGTLAQPVPDEVHKVELEDAGAVPARVWREAFEARLELDLASELDRISAPTLIVWGDQDTHALREEQQAMLDAMHDARLLVYEGAGHSLHLEEPARLAADVAAFVEELER